MARRASQVGPGQVDESSVERPRPEQPYDPARDGERRAPERLLFTPGQLLGRDPIYLRRASDKRRLSVHIAATVLLLGITAWWVLLPHAFAGPVLLTLTRTHGVHEGDLPSLAFVVLAARSLVVSGRLVRAPHTRSHG